jgi:4-carboxymuconolactone decarboxylase
MAGWGQSEENKMALVPYPDPTAMSAELQNILKVTPQNIVRMMAGTGPSFKPLMSLASTYFNNGALSPVLRELAALRIGHRLGARYVLDQHALIAPALGVTKPQMAAISGTLPSSVFSEKDNAALLLVDNLVDNIRASEDLVLNVYRLLGATAMHELFMVNGFYQMMARYTESLRIDLDAAQKGNALDGMKSLSNEL